MESVSISPGVVAWLGCSMNWKEQPRKKIRWTPSPFTSLQVTKFFSGLEGLELLKRRSLSPRHSFGINIQSSGLKKAWTNHPSNGQMMSANAILCVAPSQNDHCATTWRTILILSLCHCDHAPIQNRIQSKSLATKPVIIFRLNIFN